jgi:hypothetical protein
MYTVAGGVKQDPVRPWSLPDRVFFACGACHILAYAFLKANPRSSFAPLWIKPSKGFTGNRIVWYATIWPSTIMAFQVGAICSGT